MSKGSVLFVLALLSEGLFWSKVYRFLSKLMSSIWANARSIAFKNCLFYLLSACWGRLPSVFEANDSRGHSLFWWKLGSFSKCFEIDWHTSDLCLKKIISVIGKFELVVMKSFNGTSQAMEAEAVRPIMARAPFPAVSAWVSDRDPNTVKVLQQKGLSRVRRLLDINHEAQFFPCKYHNLNRKSKIGLDVVPESFLRFCAGP
jgi:hypothetical protein